MRIALFAALLTMASSALAQEQAPPPEIKPASQPSVLPDSAWQAIDEAIACLNMTRKDLEFDKALIDDKFRLSIVQELLAKPLESFDRGSRIGRDLESARGSPEKILRNLAALLDAGDEEPVVVPGPLGRLDEAYKAVFGTSFNEGADRLPQPKIPAAAASALELLLLGCAESRALIEKAFGKLDERERALLFRHAPEMMAGGLDGFEYEGEAPPETAEGDALFKAALKVDRKALCRAGTVLAAYAASAAEILSSEGALDDVGRGDSAVQGVVEGDVMYVRETPYGPVIVGGPGETVYRTDAFLIVDLGGDDRYLGRVAVGAGYCKGRSPSSACIDVSGNDDYTSRKSLDQGAGFLGVGVLLDLSGNDCYRGNDLAQAAGLFGVGVLFDGDGRDRYEGDRCCQAAGVFGTGLLVEAGGAWQEEPPVTDVSSNDSYSACMFSQGFGFIHGAGCLVDLEGNDDYYAGGKYLHDPLYTDRFRSMSQGFGFGSRPACSGGVGILYDRHGNDIYSAEIYGQGSSYWFAYGLLVDDRGNDSYTLTHYGQGAGIHLSVGALIDRKGNDTYTTVSGVAQGGPHDLSVGVLLDLEGNDMYFCPGVGMGCGWTNSVGIFLDLGGNDSYTGGSRKHGSFSTQGFAVDTRGFPGVGIFYDAWGKDVYSVGEDGKTWVVRTGGIGIDRPGETAPEKK